MKFLSLIFSFFTFSVLHASVYDNISAMLEATSCTFRVQMLSDGSGYGVYADLKGGTVYGSPFSSSTYVDAGFYKINNGKAGYFLIKTGSTYTSYVGVAVPGQTYVVGVYSIDGYNYKWPSTDGAPYKSWDVTIAADGKSLASADAAKQAAAAAKKAADDANAAAAAAATASSTAKTAATSANTASASTANTAAGTAGTSAGSAVTSAGATAGGMSSNSSDFAGLIASMGQVGQILVRSMEAANANSQGERALLKGAMDTMGTTATQQGAQMQAGIDSMRAGIAAQGAAGLAQLQAANETTAAVKALGSGSGSGTDVAGVESRLDTANTKLDKIKESSEAVINGTNAQALSSNAVAGDSKSTEMMAAANVNAERIEKNDAYAAVIGKRAPVATDAGSSGLTVSLPVSIRGFKTTWDFNPVHALAPYASWALLCKSMIALCCVAGCYYALVSGAAPLVSALPSNEAVVDSLKIVGTPFGVGLSWNLLRPLMSFGRIAFLATFPVAFIAGLEIMMSYLGMVDGDYSAAGGVPGVAMITALYTALSSLASALGIVYQLINMFVPIATVVLSFAYISSGYLAMFAIYLFAKFKASALESV